MNYLFTEEMNTVQRGTMCQGSIVLWRHYVLPTTDLMDRIVALKPNVMIIGREKTFMPAVVQWALELNDKMQKKMSFNCPILASSHILQVRRKECNALTK